MTARALYQATGCALVALVFSGCAHKPFDYTNFRENRPRSILVLPPMNESASVEGTYGYLSTVTKPIAERGYYVFPVAIVDRFFKENGMPTAGEMHQVPPDKVAQIMGADAVMYVTLKDYGTKYILIDSVPTVRVATKLVDTRSGILLWQGELNLQDSHRGSGFLPLDMVAAAIGQAVNTSTDAPHKLSGRANEILSLGLLYGPYHPQGADERYANGAEAEKAKPSPVPEKDRTRAKQ